MLKELTIALVAACAGMTPSFAQPFYFGADLSYVNEMEACGATFTVLGEAMDPFTLFKDHGANLVRLRLWHYPSWYTQLNEGQLYSDFEDVRLSISRAKANGLQVLLDYHLSDTWADPGHQVVPAAWADVVDDQNVLADSLRNYISSTLTKLGNENLLPDIIQIGNETNRGILLSQEVNDQGWTLNWSRNVFLFKAAQAAIDEIELQFGVTIPTAIHIADPTDVPWYIEQFVAHGYNDFDIIGISYYWQWHQPVSIPQVGQIIASLKEDHPGKDVMIFETAYGWTTQNADGAANILFNTHPDYTPLSPSNQKQWMIDLTQEVIGHGGRGLVYWEPAWVSTGCSTQWGVGSHWDNATFFSADGGLIEDGGIGWMSHHYNFTSLSSPNPLVQKYLAQYYDGKAIISLKDGVSIDFPVTIKFHSMDGRVIYSSTAIASDGPDRIQIPLPKIVPGLYLISIKDNRSNYKHAVLSIPKP